MIKQINDSAETTTSMPKIKVKTTKTSTEVSAENQKTVESSITSILPVWPTDFMTNEKETLPSAEQEDVDTLSNILNNLNIFVHKSLMPQSPLNITKIGKPYHSVQNSAHQEPSICVPITVREKAYGLENAEYLEIERVYCFPLPSDGQQPLEKNITEGVVNTLDDYEAAEIIKSNQSSKGSYSVVDYRLSLCLSFIYSLVIQLM